MSRLKYIAIIILFLPGLLYLQNRQIKFEHLTVDDGLSFNFVNRFLQDSRGFLWIATGSGLNRYDGYEFKVYKSEINNPSSLSSSTAWSLYEDASGALWIGTKVGLISNCVNKCKDIDSVNQVLFELNKIMLILRHTSDIYTFTISLAYSIFSKTDRFL
jgi:ligand-binding sensor domain-containing protein